MNKLKYQLTSPVLMWLIILAGIVFFFWKFSRDALFQNGKIGYVVLVIGLINWIYVIFKSGKDHKKAPASVNGINEIITEGMYSKVRHPIYAADIVLFWCIFAFYPVFSMLSAATWATLVFIFWANLEERMLEDKFLDDYRLYKQRVPMFIPKFKK
jgi:protein-S-isoprenylcysteine O-methyltransferase Ste14